MEGRPPSVDKVARALPSELSHRSRVEAARSAVAQSRNGQQASFQDVVSLALELARERQQPLPQEVINLSGVILHTGLGRAALGTSVAKALAACSRHQALEIDLTSGARGNRQDTVRGLLTELTGAEEALVFNNCAGALFLCLRSLCAGREVVISRGEMVEIGGSFRIPDIIEEAGCLLREVGCTNRTRLKDYAGAIGLETAAVLRCHQSNFRLVGFTESVPTDQLASLARAEGVLMIEDLGHGCLIDPTTFGLSPERTLRQAVKDGAHVVLASCDKLMGGPQAGVILGSRELLGQIERHPLGRALRVDKLTLTALYATLTLYSEGRLDEIPLWRHAARPIAEVKRAAARMARSFSGRAEVAKGVTEVGGGSMPAQGLPTWRVGLWAHSEDALAGWLRSRETPIVGRVEKGLVWLDPRTADPEEVRQVCRTLSEWKP